MQGQETYYQIFVLGSIGHPSIISLSITQLSLKPNYIYIVYYINIYFTSILIIKRTLAVSRKKGMLKLFLKLYHTDGRTRTNFIIWQVPKSPNQPMQKKKNCFSIYNFLLVCACVCAAALTLSCSVFLSLSQHFAFTHTHPHTHISQTHTTYRTQHTTASCHTESFLSSYLQESQSVLDLCSLLSRLLLSTLLYSSLLLLRSLLTSLCAAAATNLIFACLKFVFV